MAYADLQNDPRYADLSAQAGILIETLGPAYPGALLGSRDAADIAPLLGVRIALLPRTSAPTSDELARRIAAQVDQQGVHFVLADLPAEVLLDLADALAGKPVLIFNLTAGDDRLRAEDCRANLLHVAPSDAMRTDALVQLLAVRGWTRIAILAGEAEADGRFVQALHRSARKFGAEITAERAMALTADPRRREESDVALATAGLDADVYAVADASGEVGRHVPYRTARPRPVVGTAGLTPFAWHWTWDRYGAAQLQHRFEALAPRRRMNDATWAGWVALKAITQAALRSDPGDFEAMRAFLLGEDLHLDGYKGAPLSFRAWDHQLRQPILLATADATIEVAPFPQFLHQTDDLDTLGIDRPESACRLR